MTMSPTTRIAARAASAVAVVALGLSLGACTGGAAPAAAPSESVSASPTASPSPTELSTEEEAIAQAEPVVHEFFRLADESLRNPSKFKYQRFERVAVSSAQNYLEQMHSAAGEQGLHQVGTTEIVSAEANEVDLTYKPKVTPPEIPFVKFTVCYDVTNLDTVDKGGNSIVPASRKDRGVAQLVVANYEYPHGPWLATYIEYQEEKTC